MVSVTKEELGAAVRAHRLARGYRQEDLAAVLRMSRSAYSYRETGGCWFHLNDLLVLSDYFGEPLTALLPRPEPGKTRL